MIAEIDAQRIAFEQSRRDRFESAKCLLAAFEMLGVPKTLLDLGCGPGHLVQIAAALGADAWGVDVDPRGPEASFRISVENLAEPYVHEACEMVLCLEVAEHLPPEAADTLCDTLAEATGKTLLFSAATPGQGGSGHLNEQPHEYWIEKLEACGLRLDLEMTEALRADWFAVAPRSWWYGKNLVVLGRQEQKGRTE